MTTASRLAQTDPIYSRISKAVPRGVDPMLREDIVSDVYLAIREGQLHPRDIPTNARRFISAAYASFSNRWGAISLNALIGDEESCAMIDLIEDPAALLAFDRIEFRETAQ